MKITTFPKLEEFTPHQQDFIRDVVGSISRFEENKKRITEADFESVFGAEEGRRHWRAWQESGTDLQKYGTQHLNEQQKKDLLTFLKR